MGLDQQCWVLSAWIPIAAGVLFSEASEEP